MPRFDGTGPAGMGPMTGRAAGYCATSVTPGYDNPVLGRGFCPQGVYGGVTPAYDFAFYPPGLGPYGYGVVGGRWFRRPYGRGRGRGRRNW